MHELKLERHRRLFRLANSLRSAAILLAVRDIWRSRWLGYSLVLVFVACRAYWHYHLPPAGYAVTAMAVIAGVMGLRPDMRTWEKTLWFVMLLLFMSTEIGAISHDRQAQNDQFKTIAGGLTTTVDQGKREIEQLQANILHLQRLEQTQQDIERQNALLRKLATPGLKQRALKLARDITSFLHAREKELSEENAGQSVPWNARAGFDNETVKEYRQSLMPEALSVTQEFAKRKIQWWHLPYHYTCGPPGIVTIGTIEYCAAQLEFTAERLPK